jgi:hypothetical protein
MSVVRLCDPEVAGKTLVGMSLTAFARIVSDQLVESLVPAVFGPQRGTERDEAEYERQGRIRFVKLLLEG